MRYFPNSLQFRIPTVFIVSFLFILAAVFVVFATIGKNLLEKQAYNEVILSGQNIVSELGIRIALAESLASALANLGEQLPPDDALHKKLIRHVMNYEGTEAFIAGGGIWPEPYQYDPSIERRSFFWGRDMDGKLRYYDDYNNPEGPGYHQEEWYVPAKHLKEGKAFWSKSYTDPYSYQPMVTVTVPMYRDKQFYGVSTVDLKLEGLHNFLDTISQSFDGYAFAVDRNGKFLSFPDERLTKRFGVDEHGARTEEFIDVTELAGIQAGFQPLASSVQDIIEQVVADAIEAGTFNNTLAETIAQESYQIGVSEAQLISAVIAALQNPDKQSDVKFHQLFIEDDPVLGESAFAAVFKMPHTYWKIVTVMPYSKAIETSNFIYSNLVSAIAIAMLASLLIMLLLVRRILVRPISDMSTQLQILAESEGSETGLLEISDRGELGNLAFWFNCRSQRLLEVQHELQEAQDALEQRVTERTNELREEIEKRKEEQKIKDNQVARVEKQHTAIIGLSLLESLFTEDIVQAARIINETAAQILEADRCSIWLINEEKNSLEVVDLYQHKTGTHESELKLDLGECPAYFDALQNMRSLAVSDMFTDPHTADLVNYARATGVSALLDSPLRVGGKLRGVVCFEHTGEQRNWHDDEIRFSGEISDRFIQVLANAERIKSEDRIRQLAFYDPLTALANRSLFQETVKHELTIARRHHVFGSLLYLDLDNFKTLNDSLGHAIGDELLIQLARRLKETLREEDIASRLGGDEFVVLINGENETRDEAMEQAFKVAYKLQAIISEPYRLQGYEHIITSSMGITIYPEEDGSVTDILKQADTAMYRAKAEGRNRICFYNPDMQEAADLRLLLEQELRSAITNGEFEMHFQPQVDRNGIQSGAEALVRWKHPEKGMVPPKDFIPIAEETGLILEIGAWILHDACEFASQCSLHNIAVNISPLQFRQPDFVEKVKETIAKAQISPGILIIELTEGILIENIEDTIQKMNDLKEVGIRVAIDDFGTGYSSLAYLKQLPLDQLKISNDFVRDITTDPNDAIIVDTIISMAKHMCLKVVAEGVETDEQLRFLVEKGCNIYQGYHFSKPLPKDAFINYLKTELSVR